MDTMFCGAATVMFFGTFRKSNLFPDTASNFNNQKQFIRSDFLASEDGCIRIVVKWSKTNQFQKYSLTKKMFRINHPLCPVRAVWRAFQKVDLPPGYPAFVCDLKGNRMTGPMFNKLFKHRIKLCGLNPANYSSHSFRRDSATWALQCGVPGEIVQHMGEWKSAAYLAYVDRMPQLVYDKYMYQCLSKLLLPK